MKKSVLHFILVLTLFSIFVAGMARAQFVVPSLADNDGFYHIKLAWLMRTEGLKPDFPWLPLSILSADKFYDHHFLYHVALIPFTFGDLRLGAKWSAVIFSSLAFLTIWYLFYRQRVPLAWIWALGLLGISDAFLYRMSIPRPLSLSLGVLALGYLWLLEGKHWWLGILAFLYVWMYDAFPLIIALGVLHAAAVLFVERRLEYRPLIFIGVGVLLGMVINPYFPVNISFSIEHMLPKLADATAVSVGNEWFPYDTGQILKNSLPALIAFASGALALGLSERKMDVRTALGLFTALLFGLMLFQARRFVEYFPAFALIFAAFAWTPFLLDSSISTFIPNLQTDSDQKTFSPLEYLRTNFATIVLMIAVLAGMIKSIPATGVAISKSKTAGLYKDASHWLEQNTPEGSLVFQTDWDDFPRLFFYNTHNTYLIGLDPTYMQLYNAKMYDQWVKITRGDMKQPSQTILDVFGARYIHTDLNHRDFLDQAKNDPGLREVYHDTDSVIFEVILP